MEGGERGVLPGSGQPGARGVLTEEQEGQDPLKHRRRLQPPLQRDIERRKLQLHGPAPARTAAQTAATWKLAALQRLREVRGLSRVPRGIPAGRRGGGGAAPEPAGAGLCLGWEGAQGPRLGAANQARPAPEQLARPGRIGWRARAPATALRVGHPGHREGSAGCPPQPGPVSSCSLAEALGSPPGSVDRSSSAPLQHPPLNPPLPLNHPPAGGKRGTWLLWEQGTHPFIGLCPPHHPKTGEGRGHGLLTFVSSVSWKSFTYSLIQQTLSAYRMPGTILDVGDTSSNQSFIDSALRVQIWGGEGEVCAK